MPAILCSAKKEELNPPHLDTNNPQPLHITFKIGDMFYVPTGVFCGLIAALISRGPQKILGLMWKLVENGVKLNCVSFRVATTNTVTLLAHAQSYEIRVVHNHSDIHLHDLCTYILSVMLYTLKSLYPKLDPQIAFRCSCPDHKTSQSVDNLCVLTKDCFVQFICRDNNIPLTKNHQVWLGKVYSLFIFAFK